MRKDILFMAGILLLHITFYACEPGEVLPIEKTSTVNFSTPSGALNENNLDGLWIRLHLSQAAYEDAEVHIQQINRGSFNPFTCIPQISPEGVITIPVIKGSTEIMFKVIPVNDEMLTGHQEIMFQIKSVNGKLYKGSADSFELTILDDELSGKLKASETESATGFYKQEFSYNALGLLESMHWQNGKNPGQLGQYTYTYDPGGHLFKIVSAPENLSEYLHYSAGKLTSREKPANSNALDIEAYGINENGLLESVFYKKRYPNGLEELTGYRLFTYFSNGNVESISWYIYTSAAEVELIQRIEYSNYTLYENPLPYYSDIPGLLYQPKMPGKVVYQEHGTSHTYFMDYAVQGDGKVIQRKLRGPAGEELTKYYYY
ncbi:MAG: hypothetical protein JJU28_15860 [Cyclobacteriaceae bacterium]|nr:hypothetical protein [Cyclobacteriaceae bacterium]